MAIAAVPDYLGNNFGTASPGLRFGMYFQGWRHDWKKYVPDSKKNEPTVLKPVCNLNGNDLETMKQLLARQQASFSAISCAANSLQLDAISTAPFATGLGNEHPTENGFSFLNPYGLPYLPGSGVKGVLRQAARELASGVWGGSDWSEEKRFTLSLAKKKSIPLSMLDVLFGKENDDGDKEHLRGALTFWDVIPQIAPIDPKKPEVISLHVEIMTPHQKHYYQEGQSPHDSGQLNPISFLTVPPGSGFTFHIQCNLALLERNAPDLAKEGKWKQLMQAAFEHAFNWLGFGAKTAVGYGAMQEDATKKAAREEQERQRQEAARRSSLSPEDLAYDQHQPVIDDFLKAFDHARKGPYQAGQEFDSKRNIFIETAKGWEDLRSRHEAAALLEDTIKWGASKKGKDRLKEAVTQLREQPAS